MEHTLGVEYPQHFKEWVKGVLILVLMEHTLGALMAKSKSENIPVLILVLMEHTLGVGPKMQVGEFVKS